MYIQTFTKSCVLLFTFYSIEVRIMMIGLHAVTDWFSLVLAALNKMSGSLQIDCLRIPRNNAESFSYFPFHWNIKRKEGNE